MLNSGYAIQGVSLWPLTCWDCGFESRPSGFCLLCCVLLYIGPRDRPITRPAKSYIGCVCVCAMDEPHRGGLGPLGLSSHDRQRDKRERHLAGQCGVSLTAYGCLH